MTTIYSSSRRLQDGRSSARLRSIPYPGAKPYFRVRDEIEDPARLRQLLVATARELPFPKPKARPKQKLS
ncbi:hypothetical protein [Cyanobium sp. ATX-6F1]|uniref:hypothetical protein n=1 Tax=Cyanobium sp. ATX-6F1 TaxID=3137388 RepID=UPI0039BE917C